MPIQFIDNQPITWRDNFPTFDQCKGYNDIGCTTYANSDFMYAQWKQTQCIGSTNEFCNPTFTNSNPEKVTNGNFTSGSTGWVLSNATYDSVNKRINFSNSANGSMTYADSFTSFSWYAVTVTVGGNTQGNLTIALRGATNSSTIYSPGTYTFYIQAGSGTNNLTLTSASIWNGWVDDVSVKLAGADCTDFGTGAQDFSVVNGSITKIVNYATNFYSYFNFGSPIGGYYKITFTVSNFSGGIIFLADGGAGIGSIYSNGVYTFYKNISSISGTGQIGVNFSFSDDCYATISDINAKLYSNYYQVILKSTTGGTDYDISSSLIYYQDYITLKKDLSSFDPGCYQLCLYDACGQDANEALIVDVGIDDPPSWTLNAGTGTGTKTGGLIHFVSGTGTPKQFYITSVDQYPGYTNMVLDWSITTGQIDTDCSIYIYDKTNTIYRLVKSPLSNTTYTGTLSFTNQPTSTAINIQYLIYTTNSSTGKVYELTDISLVLQAYIPGRFNVYCSNCIEIKNDDDCQTLVSGYNGEDSYGFHFDSADPTYFRLGARVNAMMINPKYKGDSKTYTDSQGNNILTKTKTDKEYTLFINYTDEHNHDWLRLALLSDTVNVGTYIAGYADYVNTDGDYQPEWPDNLGQWPTAQARVSLISKSGTLFNNNAG
jgi:hypothetical protein